MRARALRAAPTAAEMLLWRLLRRGDAHFSRQVVIQGFIVDFCCRRARLVVEVDGGVHNDQVEADATRDDVLRAAGYRVVHVSNDAVEADAAAVVARIVALASTP
jgi:very-short-patch-repair endonuclease